MKLLNILFSLILLSILSFALLYLYQNLPGEEIEMKIKNIGLINNPGQIQEHDVTNISGEVTQFFPDMRFNHNNITFFINSECGEDKKERMNNAFSIIESETGIITFTQDSEENADILVGCSFDSYETEENVFIAGEGGPTKIINLSVYPIILRGKVILYNETSCDYPITELHELFHVFGFDHINDSKMIMYPYAECDQKINPEMTEKIKELYSIQPKAEIYFENINASKKGIYLDFNIMVRNEGLIEAKNITLDVYSEGKKVDSFDLGSLEPGEGTGYNVKNLKLTSRNARIIKMIIVTEAEEYYTHNNAAELEI